MIIFNSIPTPWGEKTHFHVLITAIQWYDWFLGGSCTSSVTLGFQHVCNELAIKCSHITGCYPVHAGWVLLLKVHHVSKVSAEKLLMQDLFCLSQSICLFLTSYISLVKYWLCIQFSTFQFCPNIILCLSVSFAKTNHVQVEEKDNVTPSETIATY